jgi:hypothetical protein
MESHRSHAPVNQHERMHIFQEFISAVYGGR